MSIKLSIPVRPPGRRDALLVGSARREFGCFIDFGELALVLLEYAMRASINKACSGMSATFMEKVE